MTTRILRRLSRELQSLVISCRYLVLKYRYSLGGLDSIKTDLNKQDKMELYNLVLRNDCENAVEIGSYIGASSYVIAKALMRKGLDSAALYCIDTWQNDAMTEGKRDTFAEFQKNTASCAAVIRPLKGMSYDVADSVREKHVEVDFLFIDGDHSYEGCRKDWEIYRPLLRQRAIVAFHDYGWAEGVKRVVNEDVKPLLCEYKELNNLFWGRLS